MIVQNNIVNRLYSSKVILLGEYSVIHEGEILAVPLSLHRAEWTLEKPVIKRQIALKVIVDYLLSTRNTFIDLEKLAMAIKEGVYLQSDIPSGYGLGSSGAITAGLYDLFAFPDQKQSDTTLLKQDLIDIESCFHGVSSGIDPLVIYLDKCVHIDTQGIHVIDEPLDLSHYFLIDTGKARKTAPLVEQYLEKAKNDSYLEEVERYKSIVSLAIQAQLSTDFETLNSQIALISEWQYQHLDFAILDDFRNLWKASLDMDDISLKLCGAGGGGYILGYAMDVEKTVSQFSDYKIFKLEG